MHGTETLETGHIAAVDENGIMYTIVERLQISTISSDRFSHSIPLEKTYWTVNGQPVARRSDDLFEIAATGMKLKRTDTPLYALRRSRSIAH